MNKLSQQYHHFYFNNEMQNYLRRLEDRYLADSKQQLSTSLNISENNDKQAEPVL
ncbi:hypothetical protein [Acinetobacter sp. ANC 3832]|uniref:hypothetical protein n=1 Tax=Acinetobacter sp. ANC 3832 TaxID=1977874 RepID=UPI00148A4A59|nr:hypothetical protein [Acinetobacter sp. ANC 3832]